MSVEESGEYDNFMKEMTEADNAPKMVHLKLY